MPTRVFSLVVAVVSAATTDDEQPAIFYNVAWFEVYCNYAPQPKDAKCVGDTGTTAAIYIDKRTGIEYYQDRAKQNKLRIFLVTYGKLDVCRIRVFG